jgi:hypothetical protein
MHETLRCLQMGRKCFRKPVQNGKVVLHFETQQKYYFEESLQPFPKRVLCHAAHLIGLNVHLLLQDYA